MGQDSPFVESFLQWLHAKPDPPLLAEMTERLEPVLKFTRFVVREFMYQVFAEQKTILMCSISSSSITSRLTDSFL